MLEMKIKVKGEIVFMYTRHLGDFDLNDVSITLEEKDIGLGV